MRNVLTVKEGNSAMSLTTSSGSMNCGLAIVGNMKTSHCTTIIIRNRLYNKMLERLKTGQTRITALDGWGNEYLKHGRYHISDCRYGEANYYSQSNTVPSIYEMFEKCGRHVLGDQLHILPCAFNPNSDRPIHFYSILTDIGMRLDKITS